MEKTLGEIEEGALYVSNLATFDDFRGRGVGKELMLFVERKAMENSLRKLLLDVEVSNEQAIKFYEKLRYKVCGSFKIPFKEYQLAFLRMEKSLE